MSAKRLTEQRKQAGRKGCLIRILTSNGIEARRGPYRKIQVRCRTIRFHAGIKGDWNFLCAPDDLRRIQVIIAPVQDRGASPYTLHEILAALRQLADKD